MSRSLKKLLYGLFYITLFFSVVFLLVASKSHNVVDDESVDLLSYKDLRLKLNPLFLKTGDSYAAMLALVENPNLDYGSDYAEYYFNLLDASGSILKTVEGDTFFYPGESKYVYKGDVGEIVKDVSKIEFFIKKVSWIESSEFLRPDLTLKDIKLSVKGEKIYAEGSIINNSPLLIKEAGIILVLKDQYFVPLFANQGLFFNIKGFEDRKFSLIFPESNELNSLYKPSSTEVFVYGR